MAPLYHLNVSLTRFLLDAGVKAEGAYGIKHLHRIYNAYRFCPRCLCMCALKVYPDYAFARNDDVHARFSRKIHKFALSDLIDHQDARCNEIRLIIDWRDESTPHICFFFFLQRSNFNGVSV